MSAAREACKREAIDAIQRMVSRYPESFAELVKEFANLRDTDTSALTARQRMMLGLAALGLMYFMEEVET